MLVVISCMSWLPMLLSPSTPLIGLFWIAPSGALDYPLWFRKVFAGLGEPWCRDGCIPQGCPLGMVFVDALYVPWCGRLESLPSVWPQLYADNLKCSSVCPNALFGAARYTVQYVRSVGQDVSPGKCVLFSTSNAVGKSMKLWDVSVDGQPLKVELDIRDLVAILTSPGEPRLGPFLKGSRTLPVGLLRLVLCRWGFQVKLGLVRGKYKAAGLHAVEASFVAPSSLSSFRAALGRSVWSSKILPTPWFYLICWMVQFEWTLLSTLSGVGSVRCGDIRLTDQMRSLVSFVFLTSLRTGAEGHGPVHLLLISAAELGFAWDVRRVRLGTGCPLSAQDAFGAYPAPSELYF